MDDLKELRFKLKPLADNYMELIINEVLGGLTKSCNDLYYLLSTATLQDTWPDLILTLSASGKDLGYCKLNARNFMYPLKNREPIDNTECWNVRNFIFKVKDFQKFEFKL